MKLFTCRTSLDSCGTLSVGLFPFYKWGKVSIRKFLAKQTWNLLKVMHNEQEN